MNIEQLVVDLFDGFDENRDGVISRREFVALVESLLRRRKLASAAMSV
jgi:Ca2+-binding EF-hand superfamily protein